jgi:hypothetical protein
MMRGARLLAGVLAHARAQSRYLVMLPPFHLLVMPAEGGSNDHNVSLYLFSIPYYLISQATKAEDEPKKIVAVLYRAGEAAKNPRLLGERIRQICLLVS